MQNTNTEKNKLPAPWQNSAPSPATSCSYGNGRFEVSEAGVYFHNEKGGAEQTPQKICAPLYVIAKTRDEKNGEWGRLLEWYDDDGNKHQWAMPLEMLEGDGAEVRRELARLGLHTAPTQNARNLLLAYIKVWPVDARARCVDKLGWHGDVFVGPNESIGSGKELIVFQNAYAMELALAESSTLDEWRNIVASMAAGNSRLVFATSTAFAGALADIANEDSGGFHFRGASSSGKSTALKVAASVWGNPTAYIRLWRSTTNGLEGLAALHNDGTLILDEIGQIDPASVGDAAYLLANGQGKVRATRSGLARSPLRWHLLFLSAGEESLSTIMAHAGKKSSAGQEIRLADIEADAGAGMGLFEELHSYPSASAFASALSEATAHHHGTPGMAWLRHLAKDREYLKEDVADSIKRFVADVVPAGAAGQVQRVARRFGLVAVAGELATRYNLTGWQNGEAINAAKKCFASWLEAFGSTGNREARTILAATRAFFETHGASRFESLLAAGDQRIPNRAGYYRDGINKREFLLLPETFRREICGGFDEKTVKKTLMDAGLLIPAMDGKPSQIVRPTGLGSTRVYVIRYLDEENES